MDLQKLVELVSLGFNKELAAEALRRNENDTRKSSDDLTNQETNAAIHLAIEPGKSKRRRTEEAAMVRQPNEDVTAITGVGNQGLGSVADHAGTPSNHNDDMMKLNLSVS